ncbi:MAG: squalene--hopene cyclase [Lacipirellulaceae bacterium]
MTLPLPLAALWWSWSIATCLVAGALLAASGGLLWATRTPWGRKRPAHKYAAMSLAAHLAVLGVASGVRTGGAQGGSPDAPPIRVRIVARAPQTPKVAAPEKAESKPPAPNKGVHATAVAEVPPTSELPPTDPKPNPEPPLEAVAKADPPKVAPAVRKTPPPSSTPAEAPSGAALAEQTPTPRTEPEPAQQTAPVTEEPIETTVASAPVASAPAVGVEAPAEEPTTAAASWDSPYAARGASQRLRIAEEQGGSRETESAVARGLDWLARSQAPTGEWDSTRWGAGLERRVLGDDRGGAGAKAETGLTGLALLALLGGGHTHLEGGYRDSVHNGLAYLLATQRADGDLSGDATLYAKTYCHSMATFALAEAYAETGDDRLRDAVQRGAALLVRSQSRSNGAWRYRPGDPGDTSQLGWVLMALRSAELAGVAIPPSTWDGAERFLASVAHGSDRGLASYLPHSGPTPTMTAEALYCRQVLGRAPHGAGATREAIALVAANPPSTQPVNLYYCYYGALALHHARGSGGDDVAAAAAWSAWNQRLKQVLVPLQVAHGPNAGSWSPSTLWGGYGGRVYTTALATMCLEVYYRYDAAQVSRDPWIASREAVGTPR